MQEIEFVKCMKVLHSCYLKDFDEDTLEAWYIQLKDISYQTMIKAISKISKESKYMPSISEIRQTCSEINQNNELPLNENYIKTVCSWCGKIDNFEKTKQHESRHLSVEYVKTQMEKYFNKKLTREQIEEFMNLDQQVFDEWYDKFLQKLIPLTIGEEHQNLIKINEIKNNKSVDE